MLFRILLLVCLVSACYGGDKTLFMGIHIKDNDAMLPVFLSSIENLDYEKRSICLQVEVQNDNPLIRQKVQKWCDTVADQYSSVTCEVSSLEPWEIKNKFLHESDKQELLLIIASDVFLKPHTVRLLTQKNRPIIAPMLRPVPKTNDPFRNFFLSADEWGYYIAHPNYNDVAERKRIGTFKADCVHGVYLIQTKYGNKLGFEDGSPYDFVAFSNIARANKINQFICNEREFGFFIHSDGSQKDLTIPGILKNIDRISVQEIASGSEVDSDLKHYLETFPIDFYSVYDAAGDQYWVDEKWDWIKSNYIKKGLQWEPHIEKLFKQYVKPGDTVIDIGGHIGTHSINLSRCVGPKGTVHVFEPQAKLFTELLVNAFLNHCENIKPHRFALGAEQKSAQIVHPNQTNEGMAYIGPGGENISMSTLDSFNINNVSLIKIDIEGYEIEALKGGLETIKRSKPVMIIEVFRGPECEEKLNFIRSLGYQVTLLEDNDYLCIPFQELAVM